MASGALGLGSYQSVLAGTHIKSVSATYFPLSNYHIYLMTAEAGVRDSFLVRDKVFDHRMPDGALVNGHFRLTPNKRLSWHYDRVMTSIRRRTVLKKRMERQRLINERVIADALQRNIPHPRESLQSADANAYFQPLKFSGNHWPDFWHHPTKVHLIPETHWRRYPQFGGITRVVGQSKSMTTHY